MYFKALIGVVALLVSVVARASVTYSFTSPSLEFGEQSTGVSLNSSFTFRLGVFANGFVPTADNEQLWESNFAGIGAGTPWNDEGGGLGEIGGSENLTGNAAPFTAGAQLYIWGFNSLTVAPSSEWILLSNPAANWKIVTDPGTASTAFLETADSGTFAVVGFLGTPFVGADPYIQTAMVVPEPVSAILLSGGMIGLFSLRRRTFRSGLNGSAGSLVHGRKK